MKTIIFGITGGIAAFKTQEVIKLLKKNGISIEVIMTDAAKALTNKEEIENIIEKKVYANLFDNVNTQKILEERKVEHITLADRASCIVIAPATANVMAKLAQGLADDYLTTVVLAATCPVLIFPSMNVHMWQHPATQENVRVLRQRGYIVVDPDSGPLACGYEGKGKLPHPDTIATEIRRLVEKRNSLQGKTILVTAGGTKEPIDDVRFIGNHASGKMGAALADAVTLRGANVVYVYGENSVMPQYPVRSESFSTADDLESILKKEVLHANVVFHSAAVSDFSVEKYTGKLTSSSEVILHLSPRKKILSEIKQWNSNILLIGFKAEVGISETELIKKTKIRMQESNADFMIANEVGKKDRGFAVDTNEVCVVKKTGEIAKIPLATKREIAEKIIDFVFGLDNSQSL
ncbi:MAG: bifunctional phosphopantothenoylcysteine decarboxylase/phosphopantothenate--cysteine ligase CoaBC [Patescibacteria group bacterium]|nr:bifunctional phosphopantothenoylcysteine decarboxylase/phosphopantothenate--cysteine ligase CoaBC [Patescibacteria group bacterium]